MRAVPCLGLVAIIMSACATAPSAEQLAADQAAAAKPVICQGPEDCEVKWGRATKWVLDNSEFRLRTQNDSVLETFGPLPNDPTLAVAISKVAKGSGAYEFDFRAGCANMFGCHPSETAAKASFVRAVMGS